MQGPVRWHANWVVHTKIAISNVCKSFIRGHTEQIRHRSPISPKPLLCERGSGAKVNNNNAAAGETRPAARADEPPTCKLLTEAPHTMSAAKRAKTTDLESITCKAMVAHGVNDLREEEIVVAPPKAGEVRVKVVCNALCELSSRNKEMYAQLAPLLLTSARSSILSRPHRRVHAFRPGP